MIARASTDVLRDLVASEAHRQGTVLRGASIAALVVAVTAVLLMAASGWFLAGAWLAGTSGGALAFNYMLPSALIRALAMLRTGGRYVERVASHAGMLRALAGLRPRVFAGLARGPIARALSLSTGEASARVMQDVGALEVVFIARSDVIRALAAPVAAALVVGLVGWGPALALVAVCAVAVLVSHRLAIAICRVPARDVQRATGRIKDTYAALAETSAELAAYRLEAFAVEQVMARSRVLDAARLRLERARSVQLVLWSVAATCAAALVLFAARGAPAPMAAAATLASLVAVETLSAVAGLFIQRERVDEARARLADVMDDGTTDEVVCPVVPAHGLALRLAGTTLGLAPGDRLAVSGPSGCGKTTLLEQILGLRSVPRGRIWIAGIDRVDLPARSTRSLFAYAPQEAPLLSGTVRDNLRLADPDADDAAMFDALRIACLDEQVGHLPSGLDTWVGASGEHLSGGEGKRLALARAWLRPAPWLVLDEPTEGLDRATEARLLRHLDAALSAQGRGLIVVSHRSNIKRLCGHEIDLARASAMPDLICRKEEKAWT